MTPPRLFGITATNAPIVAIIRRGPSRWCHVGRWDLDRMAYEGGAWFRGRISPQKCDLSPDGRWLACSLLKPTARWAAGGIFQAVTRLPWLHALAAWNMGTTYTRGMHFTCEPGVCDAGAPDVGDASPMLRDYGLRFTAPSTFAVERRRGWVETIDSEPRSPDDPWETHRTVWVEKARPGGGPRLRAGGSFAAFRDSPAYRDPPSYSLTDESGGVMPLENVQWAEWDATGRLLVATADGRLQIRSQDSNEVLFEENLAAMRPDPRPPPTTALEW